MRRPPERTTQHEVVRRTVDADSGISMQLAGSRSLDAELTALGYEDESGNRYRRGDRVIDLLVPSGTGRFGVAEHGERAFDAVPGLGMVLGSKRFEIEVDVTLTTGEQLTAKVKVPTVEYAVILKAYAAKSRTAEKDLIDIHNLLSIVEVRPSDTIGGWNLSEEGLRGARGDAAKLLLGLADGARKNPVLRGGKIDAARFEALIRRHVATSA